jgi:hypothetical protein
VIGDLQEKLGNESAEKLTKLFARELSSEAC